MSGPLASDRYTFCSERRNTPNRNVCTVDAGANILYKGIRAYSIKILIEEEEDNENVKKP